ncbi:MAG: hypothetical protein QNL04_11835 [SAR324 cluster bacterium]|nr:hypothetical protein [SAR324 cluster bacterium]
MAPHILWLMSAKVLAYGITPYLLYRLALSEITDQNKAKLVGLAASLWWFAVYAPVVNSMR